VAGAKRAEDFFNLLQFALPYGTANNPKNVVKTMISTEPISEPLKKKAIKNLLLRFPSTSGTGYD